MIEKLISKNLEEGFFYFQLHNIFIKSKINKVKGRKTLTKYLILEFDNGHLDIHTKTKIIEIKKPPNMMVEFDWCYRVENMCGEFLGYLGKPSDQLNQSEIKIKNFLGEVVKCRKKHEKTKLL